MPSGLQSRFWRPREGDHNKIAMSAHCPDLLSAQPGGRDAAPGGRVAGQAAAPSCGGERPPTAAAEEGRSPGTPAGTDVG